MIDASKKPLEENIELTNQVLAAARACGASVEAELGKIGGTEDDIFVSHKEAMYTEPQEAVDFVKAAPVDALAIAIGTAHGQYKGEPKLDLPRLEKIKALVNIPIVLHGSSGVPDETIKAAVSRGVNKVNIDTNIREAFMSEVQRRLAANPAEIDPRKVLGPAKEAMTAIIRAKIRIFGSSGQA
jgi:fructose-bisphosphate aldolase class II